MTTMTEQPGHIFVRQARERLGLTVAELADLLQKKPQTVWRWERDPAEYVATAREVDPGTRRLLNWMMQPGRPKEWPAPPAVTPC